MSKKYVYGIGSKDDFETIASFEDALLWRVQDDDTLISGLNYSSVDIEVVSHHVIIKGERAIDDDIAFAMGRGICATDWTSNDAWEVLLCFIDGEWYILCDEDRADKPQ
jgi:hypothetical protein